MITFYRAIVLFTRAFERAYGKTPGQIRKEHIGVKLYPKPEVKAMIENKREPLKDYDAKLIVSQGCALTGYGAIVKPGSEDIQKLWTKFVQDVEFLERKEEESRCMKHPHRDMPHIMSQKNISSSHYVQIKHEPEKRTLKETYEMFYGVWLPLSGLELAPNDTIEVYHLKENSMEIWIPVKE